MSFELKFQNFPEDSGPLTYASVPWDSEFFGFPIFQLSLEKVNAELLTRYLPDFLNTRTDGFPCLVSVKMPTSCVDLTSALANCGFYPVETLFEMRLKFVNYKPLMVRDFKHLCLRPASEADLPTLIEMAGNSFSTDRFHLDPHLSSEKADLRFQSWINQAWKMGEPILVMEDSEEQSVQGFLHYRPLPMNSVELSLTAVSSNRKIMGLGVIFYQKFITELKNIGFISAVTMVSVNNLSAINLLSAIGFTFKNAVLTMHYFKQGSA
jgi:hypothetical protein